MESDSAPFLIFAVVAVVFICVNIYNRLVEYRNRIEESWCGIDIALKRRFNLIPNMVSTVKLYSTHEAETLAKVTEARQDSNQLAERAITQSLQGLLALAEAYPDLKASHNFS